MELVGWTNDRLVAERINRLPRDEWVFGRANASIVMAAFLHVAPTGMRFSGADLGCWYAAADLATAAAEVGHHLRREAYARKLPETRRTYRTYTAQIDGNYVDIRGERKARPELYDPASYAVSQAFGEAIRASGRDGILYESVRRRGGIDVAAFRPTKIQNLVQTDHFEITVCADQRKIDVRKLIA